MKWLALLLVLTGCTTRTVKHQAIMPPAVKRAKVSDVPVPPARTHFVLRWEDCAPQSNVWYRVYERLQFSDAPTLYAELTNAHSLVIPTTHTAAFYTVEVTDGEQSKWAGKECE